MTTRDFFKGANILHRALLGGAVLFILIAVYLNATGTLQVDAEGSLDTILMIITLVMGVWGIVGALFIFNMLMKKAAAEESLSKKLVRYRAALVVRAAITEGAALLGAVAFMITGNRICLAVAVICAAFLAFMRPVKEEVKRALDLSSADAIMLDRDDAEIVDDADWRAASGY